jgi:hypothetical protein
MMEKKKPHSRTAAVDPWTLTAIAPDGPTAALAHTNSLDERRAHIDEVRRLLAAAGLTPKDMFLTQPRAPREDEVAYEAWQDREHRRRRIARRMAQYGLTAHDLAAVPDAITERAP